MFTSLRQQHNVSEQKQRNENSSQNTSSIIPKLYKPSNSYAIRYPFEIPIKIVKYTTYTHNKVRPEDHAADLVIPVSMRTHLR
jgi:hypothetical protein